MPEGLVLAYVRHTLEAMKKKRRRRMTVDLDAPRCIETGPDLTAPDCEGAVEFRDALSPTGRSYPRCDKHWAARLDVQQGLRERYPEQPPSDWSPLDAGESWDEED